MLEFKMNAEYVYLTQMLDLEIGMTYVGWRPYWKLMHILKLYASGTHMFR